MVGWRLARVGRTAASDPDHMTATHGIQTPATRPNSPPAVAGGVVSTPVVAIDRAVVTTRVLRQCHARPLRRMSSALQPQ
jgi:hypothetical protein